MSTDTSNTLSGTNGTHGANGANGTNGTSNGATAGSEAMRQRVQARRHQHRYEVKRGPLHGRWPVVAAIAGVVVVIAIIIGIAVANGRNATGGSGPLASSSVLDALQKPDNSIFDAVGGGSAYPTLMKALPHSNDTGLPAQDGKPVLIYIGAEYCPYCAADRWSLIMALNRFGTFSNLHQATSSSTDIFPSTPTFSFVGSTYSSQYLVFDAKEIEDGKGNPLQTMTSAENAIFSKYDSPPYDQTAGGIPFIDFGGQYMTSGGSYNVGVLHVNANDSSSAALSYNQIVDGLKDANSPIAQGIVGAANQYTAAICKMIDNKDQAVCSSSAIQQLEAKLPQR